MKILSILLCVDVALSHYVIFGNNGYPNNNNNYGNNEGNVYMPAVPYVLPLTFLRKTSPEAAMEFKKIGQDSSQSVREVEEQRREWAKKYGLEKEYKEFSETGEKGVASFFTSTKKLISTLDHFFTKSKNIEKDHGKSYKEMQKAVKSLLSGLSDDQKMVVGLIIDIYGISFFPFLNDAWCNRCIENGGYTGGNDGYPGYNGGYPGTNGGYPGNNGGYPGNGRGYPGGGYPSNDGGYPGNNGGYPYGNGGFQGGNGGFPGVKEVFPDGQIGFPSGNGGFSGHNGGYPGFNGGYSGGNGWFPGNGGYPGKVGRAPSRASFDPFNLKPNSEDEEFHGRK